MKSVDEIKRTYPKSSYRILFTMLPETSENLKKSLIESTVFSAEDFYDEEIDSLGIMSYIGYTVNAPLSIPRELEMNFRYLKETDENELKEALLFRYFNVNSYDDLPYDSSKKDFSAHLYDRLEYDRKNVIPWLDSIYKLKDADILEIGCGTGASTVALSEQGAKVTALDVDKNPMEVAKIRLKAYDLTADFMLANAMNILSELRGKTFDYIIYFASLEHMRFQERVESLKTAFQLLKPNGYVVIVGTPNRLWHFDGHTSLEPFFHWLPDDLAMEYAKFTTREYFNKGFDQSSEDDVLTFVRWGRSVSYHELEIALGGKNRLQVVSSLSSFLSAPDSLFKQFLKIYGPKHIHEGFYDPYLNIVLKNVGVAETDNVDI